MKKIFLIMLIFITGCFNHQPPKWYVKEYSDTNRYIFATGEGKTKKEAINDALSYAASKLSVTINSTFESTKGYFNNPENSYESVKHTIISRVKNFNFYDYKIIKSIKNNDKYYILLQIDRKKNALIILEKAKETLKEIELKSQTDDKIEIIKTYPKLIKKLQKIISDIYISKSLYSSPETDKLLKKAINLKNSLEKKLKNITFNIKNDYKNILHDSLSSLNQKISTKGIRSSIKVTGNKKKAAGLYIYKINSKITLEDKTTYTFEVTCAGKSISGFDIAKEFAIKECKKKIKKRLSSILQTQL